ncbi:hypothetical protein_gp238 [Bacillus phage vB_BceM_WH1]|nr:hypothetical protein_gp238 [Bacillus phage vB_BceM_WH1]
MYLAGLIIFAVVLTAFLIYPLYLRDTIKNLKSNIEFYKEENDMLRTYISKRNWTENIQSQVRKGGGLEVINGGRSSGRFK